jgi:ferredoxin
MVPTAHDHLVGVAANLKQPSGPSTDELVARLDAMTPEQRWAFWMAEFDRCIKCYACREVCPHCFCTQCIAEKSMPQWLSVTSSPSGNFAWNLIRAFHLAGRCGGCMECARTCPVGIPLGLLNRKLVVEVEKAFGFKIGADPEARPPLTTYKTDDNQDFIR